MLVIDASAVAELLLARPAAERVDRHIATHDFMLRAPHLLDLDVLSALRRLVAAGEASTDRAEQAVGALLAMPIERYPHAQLAWRIWQLRENFSMYDAAYVSLAEALSDDGVALLTADARLGRAVRAHSAVDVLVVA